MPNSEQLPALKPLHADLASCEEWLAATPLGDARQACTAYLTLLQDIADAPPTPAAQYLILEGLLPRMLAAMSELSRRYAARPLPLAPQDEAAFWLVCDLWKVLLRAYRKLLAGMPPGRDAQSALLAARATTCAAELLAAHLLARRAVPQEIWQWVHVSYAFADARGIADITPEDGQGQSSAHAYACAVLFALAQPHALSPRDALWARAWARRFAPKLRLLKPAQAEGMQAYCIDLGGGSEPLWHGTSALLAQSSTAETPLRVLDMATLGLALRKRLRRLEAGEDPAALGLGQGCTQPGAGALLRRLLRLWCAGPVMPRFPRRVPRQPLVRLSIGFQAAHESLRGGQRFDDGGHWQYSRHQFEQLFTFQPAQGKAPAAPTPVPGESWQVLDESAMGFGLQACSTSRVAHRQLLALDARDTAQFILAEVRWLQQHEGHRVTMGVQLLPGAPVSTAVRLAQDASRRPLPYLPAFLLPDAHGTSASLILPAGLYQRDRQLELRLADAVVNVSLTGLLDRGHDFDRAGFAPCG